LTKNIIQHVVTFRAGDIIYPSDKSFTKFLPTWDFEAPEKGELKDSPTDFNLKKKWNKFNSRRS